MYARVRICCANVYLTSTCLKHHIYSTLFKTQERKSDRSKEIEKVRNHKIYTHTNKTTRTCDHKYQTTIYCINIKLPSSCKGLEKYFFNEFDRNMYMFQIISMYKYVLILFVHSMYINLVCTNTTNSVGES